MNTKSSYAKCSQCNELTWNDKMKKQNLIDLGFYQLEYIKEM